MAAIVLAATLVVVAIGNVLVDPYRLFGVIDAPGFNAVKPRALQRGYLSKRVSIASIKPERIIIGNSRAQVGIDPESPRWRDSLTTYNAALAGTGPASMLSMLKAAVAAGNLREAVVGLEFLDFLADKNVASDAVPRVAESQGATGSLFDAKTVLATTVSIDALLDSAYTVAAQHVSDSPHLTRSGFTPMRDYEAMARREGYAAFFRQRDQENAASFIRKRKSVSHASYASSLEWQQLKEIKAICERLERGCKFIIYPYHAHILELLRLTGLWDEFEAWKREVVKHLAHPSTASRIAVWDFSGFHRYACESVPPPGDRTTVMEWYWEAGHFKRELGERIIARVEGTDAPDIGVQLDESTIDADLQRIRHRAEAYDNEQRSDVRDLKRIVDAVSQ